MQCYMLDIPIMSILMEDYADVFAVIEHASEKEKGLENLANSCELVFSSYDEDPREIWEIPEVVNWIKKSLDIGIPWMYLLGNDMKQYGSLILMVDICCGRPLPENPEKFIIDQDALLQFIDCNYRNVEVFRNQYGLSGKVAAAAMQNSFNYIRECFFAEQIRENETGSDDVLKSKQKAEALKRIKLLEKYYDINPNIRTYFSQEKLYYSYLTGSGYIGSIDTICYDQRYEQLVKKFEHDTSAMVYHAIEYGNTLALLYVSASLDNWEYEQPLKKGIPAWIWNFEDDSCEQGYIKVDVLQGALYRNSPKIFETLESSEDNKQDSSVNAEVIKRLKILQRQGIESDLDIVDAYLEEQEICYSKLMQVTVEQKFTVIQRVSTNEYYQALVDLIRKESELVPYFILSSPVEENIAILYISSDSNLWEEETDALWEQNPDAFIVDLNTMSVEQGDIHYVVKNGGPIYLPE